MSDTSTSGKKDWRIVEASFFKVGLEEEVKWKKQSRAPDASMQRERGEREGEE